MRTGQKSELITCTEVSTTFERPSVDTIVLDGAAIVDMLPPGRCKTFNEHAETVFLPYIIIIVHRMSREWIWCRIVT